MSEQTETRELDWADKIGASAYASIAEMVAALECNYERLEEIREELLAEYDAIQEQNDPGNTAGFLAWVKDAAADNSHTLQDAAGVLLALIAEAGECKNQEEARQRIEEDALSVEFRSDWYCPGSDADTKPAEFKILLTTGGPAVQIRGELDLHGEPSRAWLEVQDWGKPWTQYFQADQDTLLTYCRCFFFGE